MTGGKIPHLLIFDRHQVATNRPIIRPQFDSLGRSFQRSSACKMDARVVAKQAHVGHRRSGRKMGRHVVAPADESRFCNRIHVRNIGGLQGRFSAQCLLRFVRTTVRDYDNVLHFFSIRDSISDTKTNTPARDGREFVDLLEGRRCRRLVRQICHDDQWNNRGIAFPFVLDYRCDRNLVAAEY